MLSKVRPLQNEHTLSSKKEDKGELIQRCYRLKDALAQPQSKEMTGIIIEVCLSIVMYLVIIIACCPPLLLYIHYYLPLQGFLY